MMSLNVRFLMALFLALTLTILPLPAELTDYRPFWVLMFVLYIQFFLPNYFGVIWVFFVGLTLDILLSSILGEHAFALLLTALLATSKARRFTFFSIIQQIILIAFFCLVYQAIIFLIDVSLGYINNRMLPFEGVLVSILCWPWIKLLADNVLSVERFSQ